MVIFLYNGCIFVLDVWSFFLYNLCIFVWIQHFWVPSLSHVIYKTVLNELCNKEVLVYYKKYPHPDITNIADGLQCKYYSTMLCS